MRISTYINDLSLFSDSLRIDTPIGLRVSAEVEHEVIEISSHNNPQTTLAARPVFKDLEVVPEFPDDIPFPIRTALHPYITHIVKERRGYLDNWLLAALPRE